MVEASFPPLAISPYWSSINDDLIGLVDLIPDGQMNWSPKRELWNFRGLLLHVADARDRWLERTGDGETPPNVWQTVRSKEEIREALSRTMGRLERFLRDAARLHATYARGQGPDYEPGGPWPPMDGQWIAFHLLEHDIHHRADILHYLALLEVDTSSTGINV